MWKSIDIYTHVPPVNRQVTKRKCTRWIKWNVPFYHSHGLINVYNAKCAKYFIIFAHQKGNQFAILVVTREMIQQW